MFYNIFEFHFSCSGYYVEKRERGGDWVKVNNYPTPNTYFTIQGLHEGLKYEFRVCAVNEAGPGKPSKPTDPIIAKEQKREYLIFKRLVFGFGVGGFSFLTLTKICN